MVRMYRVISADGHIEVPPDGWMKHVPSAYKDRAPRLVKLPEGGEAWLGEGVPIVHNSVNLTAGRPARRQGESYWNPDGTPADGTGPPAQRLQEQDRDGIDAEVLYPPIFITQVLAGVSDRRVYLALIAAYNEW